MSLAPASSRGAFLKARLAVNGIQCAARSLGTLTADDFGLLSSMGASCVPGCLGMRRCLGSYQLHGGTGTPEPFISAQSGGFGGIAAQRDSQIRGRDPEHLAVGFFGVEPQQRQLRERRLERSAAAADLA